MSRRLVPNETFSAYPVHDLYHIGAPNYPKPVPGGMSGYVAARRSERISIERTAMRFSILIAVCLFATSPAFAQDAAAGAAIFNRSCKLCHSVEAGKPSTIGPNLRGVVGRPAASLAGYKFSPSLMNSKIKWNTVSLDKFLTKPSAAVPGTKMAFVGVPTPSDRANLIAYLAQQK